MKKLLYLHGFCSSGASGTVEVLRREFWSRPPSERAEVIAPDIPVEPDEALAMLRTLVGKERPSLIVGTSMGGFYAQQLRNVPRICVNPSFGISRLYSLFHVGKYKWLNARKDGAREFHVSKETIERFAEMEAHQFEGVTDDDRILCFGLFGLQDEITARYREVFESTYPGQSRFFDGGHRLNADAVKSALLPLIDEIGL